VFEWPAVPLFTLEGDVGVEGLGWEGTVLPGEVKARLGRIDYWEIKVLKVVRLVWDYSILMGLFGAVEGLAKRAARIDG
jgi:hypothetical protein